MSVKIQGRKTFRKQLCNVVRVTVVLNSWFPKQGTDNVDNWGHVGVKRPQEKGIKSLTVVLHSGLWWYIVWTLFRKTKRVLWAFPGRGANQAKGPGGSQLLEVAEWWRQHPEAALRLPPTSPTVPEALCSWYKNGKHWAKQNVDPNLTRMIRL